MLKILFSCFTNHDAWSESDLPSIEIIVTHMR
jgi:hypothetical protein